MALGIAPAAHALPPAVETDRLLLEAKTALDKADALSHEIREKRAQMQKLTDRLGGMLERLQKQGE